MFQYTYNLRSLGYEEDQYKETAGQALRLARGASAVDTGRFRTSWTVRVDGDILIVSNGVRYAPFVELGSIVYTKHRYRIKRALSTLGLHRGSEKIGTGPQKTFSTRDDAPDVGGQGRQPQGQRPSTKSVAASAIAVLTEQEIRSPALLLRRFRPARATIPTVPKIPKAQLFNRSRLLELIIAAEIVNQTVNNEEAQ